MKLGWKVILASIGITFAGVLIGGNGVGTVIAILGGVLFWAGVALLIFRVGGRPKRGVGSGKL